VYAAQATLPIDAEIAEKGRLWTETGLCSQHAEPLEIPLFVNGGMPSDARSILSPSHFIPISRYEPRPVGSTSINGNRSHMSRTIISAPGYGGQPDFIK